MSSLRSINLTRCKLLTDAATSALLQFERLICANLMGVPGVSAAALHRLCGGLQVVLGDHFSRAALNSPREEVEGIDFMALGRARGPEVVMEAIKAA